MDMKTNTQRLYQTLINISGCSYPEAIEVCKETIKILKLKEEKLQKRLKKK